jgi:hypothetical protein
MSCTFFGGLVLDPPPRPASLSLNLQMALGGQNGGFRPQQLLTVAKIVARVTVLEQCFRMLVLISTCCIGRSCASGIRRMRTNTAHHQAVR